MCTSYPSNARLGSPSRNLRYAVSPQIHSACGRCAQRVAARREPSGIRARGNHRCFFVRSGKSPRRAYVRGKHPLQRWFSVDAGQIRVFSPPVLADELVAPALGRLMARHRSLRLDIETKGQQDCINVIRSGGADLALVSTPTDERELSNHTLRALEPVAATRHEDAVATRRLV
jgi:LysR substrate binding domain-containing protein